MADDRAMVNRIEIIEAAERGDLDGLLALVSLDEIANAWWRYMMRRAAEGEKSDPDWEGDPDGWAIEINYTGILEGEDTFRDYLRALAARAPDDDVELLGYFGAGPLEDFITRDEDRLHWIEQEAERSENFRRALATVWVEDFGASIFLRLQAAARTELVWHANHGPRPMPDGSFADPSLHRHMTDQQR
jgi:hypothetical protein